MEKSVNKIIHINASSEFLANPKCMEALEELCKRAGHYMSNKSKKYLICSKCKQPDGTVEEGMFDGMCADCTQSEL